MKDMPVGIMQGRLSPPIGGRIQGFPLDTWRKEFFLAADIGLASIEWIYEERDCGQNPLSHDSTTAELRELMRETGVHVVAICADYFLDVPYLTSSRSVQHELSERFTWLVTRAKKIGAAFIDLPFVDASAIPDRRAFSEVIDFLRPSLAEAERSSVMVTLETSLAANEFQFLLERCNHGNVMANYDTGNSASLGYDCDREFEAYGKWIRTVHIKDRRRGGTTVPLGNGDTDFRKVFKNLRKIGYEGNLTLQAAREPDEVRTAKKNLLFVRELTERLD